MDPTRFLSRFLGQRIAIGVAGWMARVVRPRQMTVRSRDTAVHHVAGPTREGREVDLVLVHGLGGHPFETFQADTGEVWPAWFVDEYPGLRVLTVGFDSAHTHSAGDPMPLYDRASEVLAILESKGVGEKPILFLVHSLGGLLLKHMLKDAVRQQKFKSIESHTCGIAFFSTPHFGSRLADAMDYFPRLSRALLGADVVRPTVAIQELKWATAAIRSLHDDFAAWYRAREDDTRRVCVLATFETRDTANLLRVVDEVSGNPRLGDTATVVALGGDHLTVCKPADRDHNIVDITRSWLVESIQTCNGDMVAAAKRPVGPTLPPTEDPAALVATLTTALAAARTDSARNRVLTDAYTAGRRFPDDKSLQRVVAEARAAVTAAAGPSVVRTNVVPVLTKAAVILTLSSLIGLFLWRDPFHVLFPAPVPSAGPDKEASPDPSPTPTARPYPFSEDRKRLIREIVERDKRIASLTQELTSDLDFAVQHALANSDRVLSQDQRNQLSVKFTGTYRDWEKAAYQWSDAVAKEAAALGLVSVEDATLLRRMAAEHDRSCDRVSKALWTYHDECMKAPTVAKGQDRAAEIWENEKSRNRRSSKMIEVLSTP
jgi:hypothetical protein